MKRILFGFLVVACAGTISCNDESNNLALAQKCLNEVPQSNPSKAMACLSYIKDMDSQQANILKCGIYMTGGGLVENKLVAAAEALEDSSIVNKEAAYMAVLALDMGESPGDYDAGYTQAVKANQYCEASGVPGLRYVSGVAVAGTYLARTIANLPGALPFDVTDPASIEAAVNDLIDDCTAASGDTMDPNYAACFPADSSPAELGAVVQTLSESYCATAPPDDEVCQHISSTVADAGGNPEDIGRALFCYLQSPPMDYVPGGTPGTGECQ